VQSRARVRPANMSSLTNLSRPAVIACRFWVTRKGIHVDRMSHSHGSSSLIYPAREVQVLPARGYRPEKASHIRYVMMPNSLTRAIAVRSRFLVRSLGVPTSVVGRSAEIIHDIDLKDSKFERTEAAGHRCADHRNPSRIQGRR